MPEPEKAANNNPEVSVDQPTREISQIDHINKKLLTSLFKKMAENGHTPSLNNMLVTENNTTEDDEWKD